MNKHTQNNNPSKQKQVAIVELQQIAQMNGLSGADIQVFLTYKAHQNKNTGLSWPSVQTIQNYTLLSRSSVMRAIRGEDELVTENFIRKIVAESLKKIGFYKKYSYGLDDIPDKTKAHDDIIGHT